MTKLLVLNDSFYTVICYADNIRFFFLPLNNITTYIVLQYLVYLRTTGTNLQNVAILNQFLFNECIFTRSNSRYNTYPLICFRDNVLSFQNVRQMFFVHDNPSFNPRQFYIISIPLESVGCNLKIYVFHRSIYFFTVVKRKTTLFLGRFQDRLPLPLSKPLSAIIMQQNTKINHYNKSQKVYF